MSQTINKRDFFKGLRMRVGKKFKLMAGQFHIGIVSVELSGTRSHEFRLTVEYVGNYRKRIEKNSFKTNCHIDTITCNRDYNRLCHYDQSVFDYRSLVEIEEKKVPEVKPQVASVIINKPVMEGSVYLKYVSKGTPFWYLGQLFQRTNSDTHNALRLVDGCLCHLSLEMKVIPTTIEVAVTGLCP